MIEGLLQFLDRLVHEEDTDGLIGAAGRKRASIPAEGEAVDRPRVALQTGELSFHSHLPDLDGLVLARGDEQMMVFVEIVDGPQIESR